MAKALFTRKPNRIGDLPVTGNQSEYVIEATVELEQDQYDEFCENLLEDKDFISKHKKLMKVTADKVWHCILVKVRDKVEGILVESEGYDYARYAARWHINKTETSSQAYERNMAGVYEKLDLISKCLNDKAINAGQENWGHVGSAAHLNELLDEICEFIGAKK